MKVLDIDQEVLGSEEDCFLHPTLINLEYMDLDFVKKAYRLEEFYEIKLQKQESNLRRTYYNFLETYSQILSSIADTKNLPPLTGSNLLIKSAYQHIKKAEFVGYMTFGDIDRMLSLYPEFDSSCCHFQ